MPRDESLFRNAQFHEGAAAVRGAAIRYSERVFDTGEPMLRRAFLDATYGFRAYLDTLTGAAFDTGNSQTENIFNAAVAVLRDPAVATAFGLSPPKDKDWPLETQSYDGTGAYMIQEITRTLAPEKTGSVSLSRFVKLQRVANRGQETIAQILGGQIPELIKDRKKLDALLEGAYSWSTALKDLAEDS